VKRLSILCAACALAFGGAACGDRVPQVPKASVGAPPVSDASRQEPFKSAVIPTTDPVAAPAKAPPAGPTSKLAVDNELSGKVKRTLSTTPEVNAAGVEVSASDGVVTLFGIVERPHESEKLAGLAANVDGVRSVVNNLVVVRGS
jgi:hypothetical protein